jgi:hypothetical protein
MGYNKIPLALRYNDTTNNAEGLIEFQLNLSDVGDVCDSDTSPNPGDVLTYDTSSRCWKASATPAVAAGALSALTDICAGVTSVTQYQALVWNGTEWCPSTIPTGGGGGAVNSVNTQTGDVSLYLSSLSGVDTSDLQEDHHIIYDGANWTSQYSQKLFIVASNPNVDTLVKGEVVYVSDVTTGGDPEVSLARADSTATMPSIGVVAENIPQNQTGPVISFGTALGLIFDIAPSAGDVGKTVYVSPTNAGQVTVTKPTNANHLIQNVGILVDDSPIKVKVTGVGRANDVPNSATFTGDITLNGGNIVMTGSETVDGVNISARDAVLTTTTTTANAALPRSGGEMTGDITMAGSQTVDGRDLSVDGAKLDGIEDFADVTDATNVAAAGALMDSNDTVTPTNLDSTINAQYDIPYRSAGNTFTHTTATSQSVNFLGTQANLGNLTDVSVESATEGQSLVFSAGEANAWIASTLDTGAGFVDGPTVSSTFSSIEVDDIKVNRLLESRPTCITHFSDWLSLDVRNNGYSPSLAGGASHVQDSNLVTMNTTEYGIGVTRLKSGTTGNAQSRIMTYDAAVAPSTCGVSFAARVCPSGAWTSGTNEGVITMGLHNKSNTANEHPNAGAWFQYDHSSSNWQAITGWFTVSSNTDTGISATPESFQVLQIMIDENWETFEFYINGSSVATHLISTHNVPTSSRYGFTFSVRNGSLAGPASFTTVGNELFLDWDYRKLTHTATDRGESYIKKTLSGE